MECLKEYRLLIREALQEVAQMIPTDEHLETEIIFDDQGGHYLVVLVGWVGTKRSYAPILHLDLKPTAKVYLQHDGTDLEFALRLVEKGIPKSDIVIAYRAPHQRQFLPDFALA